MANLVQYKFGYAVAIGNKTGNRELVLPVGPVPDILPQEKSI
jgi:putative glutathione S-transferase